MLESMTAPRIAVVALALLASSAFVAAQDAGGPPRIDSRALESGAATVIYVIDVSGSMGWDCGQYTTPTAGPRIDRARTELAKSVASLPRCFRFTMFSFDCDVAAWRERLVTADDANKAEAFRWIAALKPLGGRAIGPAVSAALGIRENKLVVLLVDGAPNCGAGDGSGDAACIEAHRRMIDRANTRRAEIDVFAINPWDEFRQFCDDVASDGGGRCVPVKTSP
jgi:Mg-chelatase subunit ChlD